LDNDDAIPDNFINALHAHLYEVEEMGTLPPFKIVGDRQIVQWDLLTSQKAPLGWKSPWHRGDYAASVGFSLLCQYPQYNFSVLKLMHIHAEDYFDWASEPTDCDVIACREAFRSAAESNDENICAWSTEDTFYDISKDVGHVLMSNHFRNSQISRLYAKKSYREKVVGPETFPSITLGWDRAHAYTEYFDRRKLLFDALPKVCTKCKRFIVRTVRSLKRSARRIAKAVLRSCGWR
jgi:hypothetical protein